MNLKQVSAKNFRSFSSIDLLLPDITLLTGANSSGKSSFISALLAPFQSIKFPFYLSPNGAYVDMGDFIEMSFCRVRNQTLEVSFTFETETGEENRVETAWIRDVHSSLPQLNRLKAKSNFLDLCISQEGKSQNFIIDLKFNKDAYIKSTEFKFLETLRPFYDRLSDATTSKDEPHFLKKFTDATLLEDLQGKKVTGIEKVYETIMLSGFAAANFISVFDRMEKHINYISSFRLAPERTYYQHPKTTKIGRSGENHIDQIIEWERLKDPRFLLLKSALQELRLLSGLQSRPMKGGRIELSVKPAKGGIWSALTDVGFGISQFLPIVVADIQLGKGSTLIVAQPEIHLHPSAQALLGNYIMQRVIKDGKRYIIETHSEYLINRIRLLISKGDLDPARVALYHFQRKGCDTNISPVQFTKAGKIEGAPQDFFNTYMMDVMDIALSAS